MKVLIVESSYPKDFFAERLDGLVTMHLSRLLRIEAKLVYALDKRHFGAPALNPLAVILKDRAEKK